MGLQRSDFYITNVCPFQPPGNDIARIPEADLAQYTEELHERLAALSDPWLIVPTGNTALRALTGKSGILKHRGSIYDYEDRRERRVKVISTIHPAATFRDAGLIRRCIRDWQRIASDATFRELRLPDREHYTRPTLADLQHYVHCVDEDADTLALDIETPNGVFVCIGFSYDPAFSLTIPTTQAYWGAQYEEAMGLVQHLLACRVPKVMQNGLFDSFYLDWLGYVVNNWQWDTLAMHHALCPNESHDLAYMASVDTRQPYWKDEAKDPNEMRKYTSNMDAMYVYNGIDVCVTEELSYVYYDQLAKRDRIEFYLRHYRDMFQPLLGMSLGGIRLDEQRRQVRHGVLVDECARALEELANVAGEPLHAKTGLSLSKLKRFMYETLALPVQKNRTTGSVTTDETAIRRLMRRYPEKFGDAGRLILDFRRKSKLATFMSGDLADDDGYVRCEYRFTTETGRLSSKQNPRGTGMNLQNVDREARDIFVPRPGHILMERDLSQAESRIVGVCTGDPELIELARALPWHFDVHKFNASLIFGVPVEEVTKTQRYLGKRVVHASNYGLGPLKLSEILMLDGYFFTPDQCKRLVEKYHDRFPAIREWQARTRYEIMRRRKLVNSWEREYYFTYDLLSDEAFRRGYAFVPQSEVADITNQWGVVALDRWLKMGNYKSRLLAQVHDALLISVEPEEAWDIYVFTKESLERERQYTGIGLRESVSLTIPAEVALGLNWAEKREFHGPPSRDELEAVVAELMEGVTV